MTCNSIRLRYKDNPMIKRNPEVLEGLLRLKKQHPHWPMSKLAEHLKKNVRTICDYVKELKTKGVWPESEGESDEPTRNSIGIRKEFNKSDGSLSSVSPRIKTKEDLLAAAEVDLNEWEVDKWIVNKWEVGRKDKQVSLTINEGVMDGIVEDSGKIHVEPLWQVKIWLKRRTEYLQVKSWVDELIAEFKTVSLNPAKVNYSKHKDGHLLEVSIFDLHLGKLAWSEETGGSNYDIKITESAFREALESLIVRSAPFPISKILFVVGNDFYHTDNSFNTTTAGTPQDADGRWQKSFVVGKRLMIEAILRLREIAPVEVLCVAGNHDQTKVFYLGEVLHSFFCKTAGVTINNSPKLRKYFSWGNNLILFTHGDKEKHDQLPLIMATEQPELWGKSKHREVHTGHFHSKKNVFFDAISEHAGVRVRILPSLSENDAWHASKGYTPSRSAEAYIYHPSQGVVGYVSYNP